MPLRLILLDIGHPDILGRRDVNDFCNANGDHKTHLILVS